MVAPLLPIPILSHHRMAAFNYSYAGEVIDDPANFKPADVDFCAVIAPYQDPSCETQGTTPGSELITRVKLCTADGWNDTDTPSIPEVSCKIKCKDEFASCGAIDLLLWPSTYNYTPLNSFNFGGGSGSASVASLGSVPKFSSIKAFESAIQLSLDTGQPLVGDVSSGAGAFSASSNGQRYPSTVEHGQRYPIGWPLYLA